MGIFFAHSNRKQQFKMAIAAGITAAAITLCAQPLPVHAALKDSIKAVEEAMTMLGTVADTGVAISLTPFGIGFALNIAKHVLRAGT